jgi:hypothetical protein
MASRTGTTASQTLCKIRLVQCAPPCTYNASGCYSRIRAWHPLYCPDMLLAPSYVGPRRLDRGSCNRSSTSRIHFARTAPIVSAGSYRPRNSSCGHKSLSTKRMQMDICSFRDMSYIHDKRKATSFPDSSENVTRNALTKHF